MKTGIILSGEWQTSSLLGRSVGSVKIGFTWYPRSNRGQEKPMYMRILFSELDPETTRNRFWDFNPLGKIIYLEKGIVEIPEMGTKAKYQMIGKESG